MVDEVELCEEEARSGIIVEKSVLCEIKFDEAVVLCKEELVADTGRIADVVEKAEEELDNVKLTELIEGIVSLEIELLDEDAAACGTNADEAAAL